MKKEMKERLWEGDRKQEILLDKNGKKLYNIKCCECNIYAQIAQSVEQGTENPCVAGSIPALGIYDL